jgi:hypothetical protein
MKMKMKTFFFHFLLSSLSSHLNILLPSRKENLFLCFSKGKWNDKSGLITIIKSFNSLEGLA